MNIKILKLGSGDDIISNIEEKDEEIILNNPARLMMFPTEEGGMGMGLVPWCPYTDKETFTINSLHVITMFDAPEELSNEYNKQFGSGIVTPPTSIIV